MEIRVYCDHPACDHYATLAFRGGEERVLVATELVQHQGWKAGPVRYSKQGSDGGAYVDLWCPDHS